MGRNVRRSGLLAVLFPVFLLGPAAALLVACASVPLPQREGVDLYQRKCGGCHRLYAPSEIPVKNWDQRLGEMAKRAHLTAAETETIRRYVEPDLVRAPAAPPLSGS